MEEECKGKEKAAKVLEKEDPLAAIEKYREAALCYAEIQKTKNQLNCLAKSADIYRAFARGKEDPVEAYELYGKASILYEEAEKKGEIEKVLKEANQKLIDAAKKLRDEAKKMDDLDAAEEKFSIAATYAIQAEVKALADDCWIDSGNQFRKFGSETENLRQALNEYKHAIDNYRRANASQLEESTWSEAGNRFFDDGEALVKSDKDLVLAIDNYLQAYTLFTEANEIEKASTSNLRIDELCAKIGLPLDYIRKYLHDQGLTPISVEIRSSNLIQKPSVEPEQSSSQNLDASTLNAEVFEQESDQ